MEAVTISKKEYVALLEYKLWADCVYMAGFEEDCGGTFEYACRLYDERKKELDNESN